MPVAYFDCFSGAGGDMIVASLLDAGASADRLREGLDTLGVGGYSILIEPVTKQGFAATRFHVQLDRSTNQPHRHLKELVEIIEGSKVPQTVQRKSIRVFERLAEAEARVHGTSIEQVHFHEVGAVDAIIDVVGAVIALELLGVERVVCSPIPTGSGTVRCEHGLLPIPAPATAELLVGVPTASSAEVGELTTPTAAAWLTTLADEFGPMPAMTIRSIGYGAGTREGNTCPNLLRVLVGEPVDGGDTDQITVLETNLDDVSPEVIAYCMERLFNEGALDVYTVPIHMKKSRSGVMLTVLSEPHRAALMERIVFAETPTFGIRRHTAQRVKLRRRHETVETPFGPVRIKVGERNGIVTASPEYEDCKVAARKHGVPLRTVIAAAQRVWTGGA